MRRANAVLAIIVSGLAMALLAAGYGPIPALGAALQPGGGVWGAASDAKDVGSRAVRLDGMAAAATVSFAADGVPTVHAASERDLFLVQGYLQATFRLTQLDMERRTARGRLAELIGPSVVDIDTFDLQTGLLRTAEANWAATPSGSPLALALQAYSQGVNNRLAELHGSGHWPALFSLTGVYPRAWTPVDSLAIAGLVTQMLSYTTTPLDNALLHDSLGADRARAWFPEVPANPQRPFDPGPYRDLGVEPLPATANANAAVPAGGTGPAGTTVPRRGPTAGPARHQPATFAADLLTRIRRLPGALIHTGPDSNAWAANGPAVGTGRSMLAGDPHLSTTLPSFWYQMALGAPELDATGASLVGFPGIVIGRNTHIAWSITDAQNQSTLVYTEQTSPDRPGQYYWNGAWRDMKQVKYTIPVRGGKPVPLTVDLTVHGPVMTVEGRTVAVTWMGNYPSRSFDAIVAVNKASTFQQFRDALRAWRTPTVNFVYADDKGNIGAVAAGYFPLVKAGEPDLPLPGTGEFDVVGTIPYDAAPQVYNPPGHVVATANQRPVSAAYPYYVGTSLNSYDNGYRANRIYQYLDSHRSMSAADFVALQNDVTDYLATLITPKLTEALRGVPLTAVQRTALDQLVGWDNRMTVGAAGAGIWWTFWSQYLTDVFQPWWDAMKVPVDKGGPGIEVSVLRASLNENLETWTLHDPGNPAFSPPGRPPGNATTAMRKAFTTAVADLTGRLGADPAAWNWGKLHTRELLALTRVDALGYGPRPAEGDPWTVNAAYGGMNSSFGPSWRMVVDWTGPGTADATAIYPGGQSENPASSWYLSFVDDWWNGRLRPLPMADDGPPSTAVWALRPGE
jgi:penicillin amidase